MWLQKVSSLDITDCPALCEELNTFTAVLDTLQNALARKLRFIKAADKSSGLMGSLAKQMERMHASYTRDKL
jgi:plasmid maintenance system killer protein